MNKFGYFRFASSFCYVLLSYTACQVVVKNIYKRINQWAALLRTSLSCKIVLLSPMLFVWLAHTSSGCFTVQLRVPDCVYIPKSDVNFKLNTKHSTPIDLRIGTAKLVVIRPGNRGGRIFCKVWHNCNHFRAHSFS